LQKEQPFLFGLPANSNIIGAIFRQKKLAYLLFILYLLGCCWLLAKIKFVQKAGLRPQLLWLVLLVKTIIGLAHGWLTRNIIDADNWHFHNEALKEYHLFFEQPKEYLVNIFSSGYSNAYGGYFTFENSFWNDIKTNLMVKLVSVFHFFSGGNYYTNIVLYNLLVILGMVVLFRLFVRFYPNRRLQHFLLVFCLPSIGMFTSIIHKEGLVLVALAVILYFLLVDIKGWWQYVLLVLLLVFVLLLRNYVLIALVPALLAYKCCGKLKAKPIVVFLCVYALLIGIAFFISILMPSLSLPALLAKKQASFFSLNYARSYLQSTALQSSWNSLLSNLPQAFSHGLLRPFVTDYSVSPYLIFFFAELYVCFIVMFWGVRNALSKTWQPFGLLLVFFSISVLLITGYTVTVLWAIIRYRSIYFPFLLAPFLAHCPYTIFKYFTRFKLFKQLELAIGNDKK
jgi:hypothetical protein